MKKILFFTGILCSTIARLQAHYSQDSLSVSGEWLYLLAGLDAPYFAINTEGGGIYQGNQFVNYPDWHSGVRVEAAYHFCDTYSALRLRGTYLPQFSNSRTVTGSLVTQFGVFPVTSFQVSADHTINFYNIELLYDHEIPECSPFRISVQAGLQYAHLNFKGTYETFPIAGGVDENIYCSTRNGIGPEIGAEVDYFFCQPLSIKLAGWATLLVAKNSAHWDQNGGGDPLLDSFVKDDTLWKVLPATDLRLGLHYSAPISAFCTTLCLDIEVGYEVLCYYQAFSQLYAYDLKNFYYNFSAHGPYAHLGVTF